jgi:hypothetical protein
VNLNELTPEEKDEVIHALSDALATQLVKNAKLESDYYRARKLIVELQDTAEQLEFARPWLN